MIAWVLLVVSVTWGILLSTRVFRKFDNPAWLLDLHRWLSGLSLTMVALHMFSLYIDKYAHFSIQDLLVPFHSSYTKVKALGKIPVALGVICAYLMVAVQSTSLMMRVLPRRFWKAIHYSSYAVVLMVSFHAGWTGTDTRAWMYRIVALTLIMFTTVALIVRILFPKPAKTLAAKVEGRRPNQLKESISEVVVKDLTFSAKDVLSITFEKPDKSDFPIWSAGGHITLHLPNDLKRQYSLCGDPADRSKLAIAVLKAENSRGGSRWIHEELRVGARLNISGPQNHFELEPASNYYFVAGGIGITPMKAMIETLPANRNWKLLYLGRARQNMPFADELVKSYGNRVLIHARDEHASRADLALNLHDFSGHVYTCGPESMLEQLQSIVPADRLHFERFAAVDRSAEFIAHEYEVELNRSRKAFTVGPKENLLKAIMKNGGDLISSCGEGVCGTCEVRVLAGEPLHLDSVMNDVDKNEIGIIYPCVSRAKSDKLVLDI